MSRKLAYFDCFCGAAGDMIVGALLDAGASFDAVRDGLESLGVEGLTVEAEKIVKKGISATQFRVIVEGEDHPHRHLRHVVEIIERGTLPETVKAGAIATFRRLAEAEAAVHGSTIEKVHFHEVGAHDSIADVVGAHLALHSLGIDAVQASALITGHGTVKCAHGIMPVPAPATAKLLEGIPWSAGDVDKEMLTPTGAALLAETATRFGPAPMMTGVAIGYGAGTRDLPDRPNVLRVLIGEAAADLGTDEVVVLETMLDDMSPELLPPLVEGLLDAGALDAWLAPVIGKKGRPGQAVTVLCPVGKERTLADYLLAHSTTLGLRMRTEQRLTLGRRIETVVTPFGEIRVKVALERVALEKVALEGERVLRRVPEFEDCRQAAAKASVPVHTVYDAAIAAAHTGEGTQ